MQDLSAPQKRRQIHLKVQILTSLTMYFSWKSNKFLTINRPLEIQFRERNFLFLDKFLLSFMLGLRLRFGLNSALLTIFACSEVVLKFDSKGNFDRTLHKSYEKCLNVKTQIWRKKWVDLAGICERVKIPCKHLQISLKSLQICGCMHIWGIFCTFVQLLINLATWQWTFKVELLPFLLSSFTTLSEQAKMSSEELNSTQNFVANQLIKV